MASPAPNGTSAAPDAPKTKTTAADVGWQFVPQYYTMLHDAPERLHCFYNKKSTFVHGVEGEVITASHGQQEIHQKVMSLGFSDCKAYIHHIDAQTSFSGGIVLQVIGEISNNSGPWRKFTQTFFLAEQPNGYFVLNDIFRYLKEDDEEDAGDDEDVESAVGEEQEPEVEQAVEHESEEATPSVTAEAVHSVSEPIKIDSDTVLTNGQPPVATLVESAPPVEAQEPSTNTVAAKAAVDVPETPAGAPQEPATPASVETAQEVKEEKPAEEEKAAPVKEETPAPIPAAATPEPTPAPAQQQPAQQQKAQQPKPAASQRQPSGSNKQTAAAQQQQTPASTTSAPAPTPVAAPSKPAAPRTWASTAAAKPNAWGTALATKEALSASAQTQQRPAAQRNPSSQQPQPAQSAQPQQPQASQQSAQGKQQSQGSARFPLVDAARAVQTSICFVKLNNWQAPDGSQPLTEVELRQILNKYGEIIKVEIVRDKACAFVEFAKVESARKAIIASLLTVQGGDGGIKTAQGHRIMVESRKEKSERKAGSVTPASAQGQTQPQPAQTQQAQGQGPKRQQGQAQNGNNHNQNQNQNQNQRGGMKGGRGGKTGQASQAGNAK
ncbi:hypothetical protein QFC24_004898 [Naganishia onofrii]|uniref:Uncharacterized protein n=1 Tax=Naganishia onofrii TaxID=1851511 RepID=A0ACC2XB32_9TREE|nr:hypothetical protein QFC24_004898 [Naganishia onofrii]